MTFRDKLQGASTENNSLLCVGLDPDVTKMSPKVAKTKEPLYEFCKAIIDATADVACVYKPNSAFFEAHGDKGIAQLKKVCAYIQKEYPFVPILLDYKRGDIGNTNSFYAQFAFDYLGVDAITIQPYQGQEAIEVFLEYKDKGIIVLCRTSNPGSGEFQTLEVDGEKLYMIVAKRVMNEWNSNHNCALVMGSPYPEELAAARQELGDDVLFLIPGAGTQGGSIENTVKAGKDKNGAGMMINSSREILYASNGDDFATTARAKALELRDEINKYR